MPVSRDISQWSPVRVKLIRVRRVVVTLSRWLSLMFWKIIIFSSLGLRQEQFPLPVTVRDFERQTEQFPLLKGMLWQKQDFSQNGKKGFSSGLQNIFSVMKRVRYIIVKVLCSRWRTYSERNKMKKKHILSPTVLDIKDEPDEEERISDTWP